MQPRVLLPVRTSMLLLLLLIAGISFWILHNLTRPATTRLSLDRSIPDYYMEDFTTIVMDAGGSPAHRLKALYIAHFPDSDMTQLLLPSLELQSPGNYPVRIAAEKGWVTANNEMILLQGNVEMTEFDDAGNIRLHISTDKASILPENAYAETDQYAEIEARRSHVSGTGMRVHFHQGRLEVLQDVHTQIRNR